MSHQIPRLRRLNVLISAHEFSPFQGSECSVGWNLVMGIAKHHNVIVVHADKNQFQTSNYTENINNYFRKNPNNYDIKFVPIKYSILAQIIIRINKSIARDKTSIGFPVLYFFAYNLWQRTVYNFVKKNINISNIDIIHHLTSITLREPGYLWKLSPQFVWGPISGIVKIPRGFFNLFNLKQSVFQILRNIYIDFQLLTSLRLKAVIMASKTIYCVTTEDLNYFKMKKVGHVFPMLDVGCFRGANFDRNLVGDIKFVWMGRIVYSKALEIFLMSIEKIKNSNLNKVVNFTIIGDGPEIGKCKKIASDLGLNDINWTGTIPHRQALEILKNSHCLVHTSIREATSASILEALSFGIPVICHDAFGMGLAVNKTCGIKIEFKDTNTSVNGFSEAMLDLINNDKFLMQLSKGASERSISLSWENMAEEISSNYYKILSIQ